MNPAVLLTCVIAAGGVLLGLVATNRRRAVSDIEEWSVGGRNMGSILLWVLMAGEAFTTFTFLGASGQAYAQGAPSLFVLAYGPMAYTVSFFLLPPLWRYAKRHGLVTQGDFFVQRFQSQRLGALVAVIGVLFMVPYTVIQLVGLGDIVTITTDGAIPRSLGLIVAFTCVAVFVYIAGIRSIAWTAMLKDVLIIVAVVIVGVVLPLKYFGSFPDLLDAVNNAHPGHLSLPGSTGDLGVAWFISTIIMSSLGFFMYPHLFAAGYTAKSPDSIRRNATYLPFYQLALVLMLFAGLVALMRSPGLEGADTNFALLRLVADGESPWVAGLIGGAGALAAMVPASALVLSAATLLSRNVYRGVLRPTASDRSVFTVSRVLVLVVMLVSLGFALTSTALLSTLLLTAYAGVSQFFPAVVLSMVWRRVTLPGVVAGILVGECVAFGLLATDHAVMFGLNVGLLAMAINAVVLCLVSLATPGRALGTTLAEDGRTSTRADEVARS